MGYLIEQGKRSQTVKSYVSGLKAILSEVNVKLDNDSFLLSALTRACKFKNDRASMRLPIGKNMLRIILAKTHDVLMDRHQPYLAVLYCALFSTAYYGLFRVGELTSGSHPVRVGNVHTGRNKKKMLFILESSKTHGKHMRPQSIKITSISSSESHIKRKTECNRNFCPYELINSFIQIRPRYLSRSEPFFIFQDRSPVKPIHMRQILKSMIHNSGFDQDVYNCQRLHIGRASDLLKMGISVDTIKKTGKMEI